MRSSDIIPNREIIEEIENLRKHEDEIISSRVNIFLIAHGLLVAAISMSSLSFNAKLLVACLGVVLSILWFFIGVRHTALMRWYADKIAKDNLSAISRIHAELHEWKKGNLWYSLTGQNLGFRANNILCIWVPVSFLTFWVFMIFFLL